MLEETAVQGAGSSALSHYAERLKRNPDAIEFGNPMVLLGFYCVLGPTRRNRKTQYARSATHGRNAYTHSIGRFDSCAV